MQCTTIIPCYNEAATLGIALAALPREVADHELVQAAWAGLLETGYDGKAGLRLLWGADVAASARAVAAGPAALFVAGAEKGRGFLSARDIGTGKETWSVRDFPGNAWEVCAGPGVVCVAGGDQGKGWISVHDAADDDVERAGAAMHGDDLDIAARAQLALVQMHAIDVVAEARQALGYRELWDYLDTPGADLDATADLIRTHTRQFAKRQLTWFRHLPTLAPVPADAADAVEMAMKVWEV